MHIFPYSQREGTVADKLRAKGGYTLVDPATIKLRVKKLEKINKKFMRSFVKKMSGQEFEMLIETTQDGFLVGHTENFIKCYLETDDIEVNVIKTVKIVKPFKDGAIVKIS